MSLRMKKRKINPQYLASTLILSILMILIVQFLWIKNNYILYKTNITEKIEICIKNSLDKELVQRLIQSPDSSISIKTFFSTNNIAYLNSGKFQEKLIKMNCLFSIANFNNFFHDELQKDKELQSIKYTYTDFLGKKIRKHEAQIKEFNYHSQIIYLSADSTKGFQILAKIPFRAFFDRTLYIILLTLFFLIFVIHDITTLVKMNFRQKSLENLRNDFTHSLIHDMKTPISTIYMAIEALRKGKLDTQTEIKKRYIEIAISQSISLQALVDRVLTIAKAEEYKLNLKKENIDIRTMINSIINNFKINTYKKVEFSLDFKLYDTTEIIADRIYINEAINNLIDNAIKYSNKEVNIHIICKTQKNGLYIHIIDNGYGIAPKYISKIFDKYERGDAIGQMKGKGFGLGLNYTKRIIEAHEGTIIVSSTENIGSEFIIYLPAKSKKTC